MKGLRRVGWLMVGMGVLATAGSALGAPKAELWEPWTEHDPKIQVVVDHGVWNEFLERYVVSDHPSGIHRFDYTGVTAEDRARLVNYVAGLRVVEVSLLTRAEQLAYWINLYNALTVRLVLKHGPEESIREIRISPGLFAFGPWEAKLLTIQGRTVSLNDMEHRILRPIWQDPRIHYVLNCASLGCPNLQGKAFSAGNTEELLSTAAREFVNHPRGVRFEEGRLHLSSIFDWFQADFGDSREGVILHLLEHAEPELAEKLRAYRGRIKYSYDWSLNRP